VDNPIRSQVPRDVSEMLIWLFPEMKKTKLRGTAVAASPKLWIVSARRATLPEVQTVRI